MLLQQLQQLTVKLMSMPVLINHILPAGIQYPKITDKIPESKPYLVR